MLLSCLVCLFLYLFLLLLFPRFCFALMSMLTEREKRSMFSVVFVCCTPTSCKDCSFLPVLVSSDFFYFIFWSFSCLLLHPFHDWLFRGWMLHKKSSNREENSMKRETQTGGNHQRRVKTEGSSLLWKLTSKETLRSKEEREREREKKDSVILTLKVINLTQPQVN